MMKRTVRTIMGCGVLGLVAMSVASCMSSRTSVCDGRWQGRDGNQPIEIVFVANGDLLLDGKKEGQWKKTHTGLEFTNPHDGQIMTGEITPGGALKLQGKDGRVITLSKEK
jgi:hypothetical protein